MNSEVEGLNLGSSRTIKRTCSQNFVTIGDSQSQLKLSRANLSIHGQIELQGAQAPKKFIFS